MLKQKLNRSKNWGWGDSNARRVGEIISQRYQKEYRINPKHCKFCDAIIPYKSRRNDFCNQSCSASYNNRGVRRHGQSRGKCEICGKTLTTHYNKCCNETKCKTMYTVNHFPSLSHLPYSKKAVLKRYYILIRGHKCENCGLISWLEQPIPLILHHINGDAYNWCPENVQLLCGNCHPFTPNFCGKNKGKSTRKRVYSLY